jgi:hypothetical protein
VRVLPALALLGLSVAAAAAQDLPKDFLGTWALKPEWCKPGPNAPEDQPRPFTLSPGRLVIEEMTCEFTSVSAGGIVYEVEADCAAGNAKGKESFVFSMLERNLVWGWDTQSAPFTRCPE